MLQNGYPLVRIHPVSSGTLGHWDKGQRHLIIPSDLKHLKPQGIHFHFFGAICCWAMLGLKVFVLKKNTSLYFNPCKTSRFLFLRFFVSYGTITKM